MSNQISFPPLHDLPAADLETRKQHLLGEITREPEKVGFSLRLLTFARRRPAIAFAATMGVAACIATTLVFTGPQTTTGSMIPGIPGPTLQDPLGSGEQQTTLSAASAALGQSIVLPDTTSVQSADAGVVWQITGGSETIVAVTFPSQGMIVEYRRPVPYSDPLSQYQGLAQSVPSSQVISLDGTPAFVIPQNSDSTGANFGVVLFEVNGSEVRVMGHTDNATLEGIAQSILDRSGS